MSEEFRGTAGYLRAVRQFSRNARLYLIHIWGMDLIHGIWDVLFNLYLLAIGFSIEFVGLRLLIQGVAGAVSSLPAGVISDRIGRKWSFILGDGGGAAVSLVNIMTTNPAVLLLTPVLGAFSGSPHAVSEPAFMAENSRRSERVHLFSVGGGFATLAVMAGALMVGAFPGEFASTAAKVALYRWATFIGIGLWFLSLIPAWLLRELSREEKAAEPEAEALEIARPAVWRLRGVTLGAMVHPATVLKLVLTSALISLGAGFVVPLFNVFFHEGLHAHEHQIGATVGVGNAFLAGGALLVPLVAERLGKIQTVVATRLLSIPFIFLIAFSSDLAANLAPAFTLAGIGYIARIVLMNMAAPVESAFSMEILDPTERGTTVGLQQAAGRLLSSVGSYSGAVLMNGGDFRTPFLFMAATYMLSTALFWAFFRRVSPQPAFALEP